MDEKKLSACRSCGAPILWVKMASGKMNPLDPEPRSDGNVMIEGDPHDGIGKPLPKDDPYTGPRYVSHFATCPQAGSWKR